MFVTHSMCLARARAQSQLRSLSSGLDAHGGGVEEAHRGPGWDGWREEGGTLSPEGVQASKQRCVSVWRA